MRMYKFSFRNHLVSHLVIPISCWLDYVLISGQNSLEACDEAIKKYEHFIDQMATNDEKINTVLSFANRLCDEDHYAADKINKKAENIDERSVLITCLLSEHRHDIIPCSITACNIPNEVI